MCHRKPTTSAGKHRSQSCHQTDPHLSNAAARYTEVHDPGMDCGCIRGHHCPPPCAAGCVPCACASIAATLAPISNRSLHPANSSQPRYAYFHACQTAYMAPGLIS